MKKIFYLCMIIFVIKFSYAQELLDQPVKTLNIDQYTGTWYEIARLPFFFEDSCLSNIMVRYEKTKNPKKLKIINRCIKKGGKIKQDEGFIFQKKAGEFRVSFAPLVKYWGWFSAPYNIIYINKDYSLAVVSTPDHKYFWLLSRKKSLPKDQIQTILQKFQKVGFDFKKLILIENS